MNSMTELSSILIKSNHITIAGHINPDGDCIGSALALGLALESIDKTVTWVCGEKIPDVYKFLPGAEKFRPSSQVNGTDTLILVDCSDLNRIDEGTKKLVERCTYLINIDHHVSNKGFGTHKLLDHTASATGEIIFGLIKDLGIKITKDMATNIYTAIVTDTGSFRYENTTAVTHRIAAELLNLGIAPAQIVQGLYDEMPHVTIEVIKVGLNNLKRSADGKVAWIVLNNQDLANIGALDEHTDGLINYARMIKGVEVAILFRENADGLTKVSFRSKNRVDVNKLAGYFNGGGHAKASGCRLDLPLHEGVEAVVQKAMETVATE